VIKFIMNQLFKTRIYVIRRVFFRIGLCFYIFGVKFPLLELLLVSDMDIIKKLKQLENISDEYFGFHPDCQVIADLRGQAAGKADVLHGIIRLNGDFLHHYPEKMTNEVLPHEYAHILSYEIDNKYGVRSKPHGSTWKKIMGIFGLTPKRTHDFDIKKTYVRKMKYFLYICGCRKHYLSAIRHNRIKRSRGKFFYSCRVCGKKLKYIEPLGTEHE